MRERESEVEMEERELEFCIIRLRIVLSLCCTLSLAESLQHPVKSASCIDF